MRGQVFQTAETHAVYGSKALREDEQFVEIPLYNVVAAAGTGNAVENEQAIDIMAFNRGWLRQELRISPDDALLMPLSGNSMEPTLHNGELLMLDRRDTTVQQDGIYVLRFDSTVLVKRLQRLPGGVIEVTSDNSLVYKPFKITLADVVDDFAIIGRVIWTGRRI